MKAFLDSSKIFKRAKMLDLIPMDDAVRRSAVQVSKSKVADDKVARSGLSVADKPSWSQFPFSAN